MCVCGFTQFYLMYSYALPRWLSGKESTCQYLVSVPGLGRFPGEGNGNLLQYSCLENSMNRGDWWLQPMGLQRVVHELSTHIHTTPNCQFISPPTSPHALATTCLFSVSVCFCFVDRLKITDSFSKRYHIYQPHWRTKTIEINHFSPTLRAKLQKLDTTFCWRHS